MSHSYFFAIAYIFLARIAAVCVLGWGILMCAQGYLERYQRYLERRHIRQQQLAEFKGAARELLDTLVKANASAGKAMSKAEKPKCDLSSELNALMLARIIHEPFFAWIS